MSFDIAKCTPDDMGRVFAIFSDSFAHENVYVEKVFPLHSTEAGRAAGRNRFRAMMEGDPNTTFIKATDPKTGVIVGFAKWNVYDGFTPEEISLDGDYWDSQEDKDLANEMFHGFMKLRRSAIKNSNGHLVSLDIMAVHPDYQRMGVGKMLLKWGVEIADKMKVRVVVEATDEGQMLYVTEDFYTVIENHTVNLSDRFADRVKQTFHWMVRLAKGS